MLNKIYSTGTQNKGVIESFRFVIVGVINNVVGYILFLFMIYVLGIGHKITVTLLFAIGMIVSFLMNKKWTFKTSGNYSSSLLKFLIVYLLGYSLNIVIVAIFVDRLSYSSGWVQLWANVTLPIYYFLANKYYVYREPQK